MEWRFHFLISLAWPDLPSRHKAGGANSLEQIILIQSIYSEIRRGNLTPLVQSIIIFSHAGSISLRYFGHDGHLEACDLAYPKSPW